MLKSLFAAAAIAVIAAPVVGGEARADNWFDFGFLHPHRSRVYYSGPDYMPAGRSTSLYGDPAFDESYYDPTYDRARFGQPPPARKPVKKKTVHTTAPATAAAKTATATLPASPAKSAADLITDQTAGPDKADKTASPGKPAAASPSLAMSCDKASKVVSDYGFSDVKPAACSGATYAFNAIRDGKPYSVKLDAASGELTEVKKVQ